MLVEPIHSTKQNELTPATSQENKRATNRDNSAQLAPKSEDTQLLTDVLNITKQYIHASEIGLDFTVHGDTGRVKISVTDKETGEVIREIPPERVLNLMAKLDEMMGIIFDEKA